MSNMLIFLLKEGVLPEYVVPLSVFSLGRRSLECNGIRFRRVLFGMEGRLGQMMP